MDNTTIPTDQFSRRRRELTSNPGAIASGSTVHLSDFYGNLETWVVETFRVDGADEVLLQRAAGEGSLRLVLPPKITAAIARHQAANVTRARRRSARAGAATRKAKGATR